MIPETMKAVVLDGITPADEVKLSQVPVPDVKAGWVLIRVKAFGLNHSEEILRLSEIEAPYIQKPLIPGIECVGEVADPGDSGLEAGQKVAALMGGLGRSFDGSYAEYVLVPRSHVFAVKSDLDWAEMAAVPETWFTAWGSLFQNLQLKAEDTLLIRGATCALGYAALQLASTLGCRVIATTHKESKLPLLKEADEALLDTGPLYSRVAGVTKALELVGPRTLRDTLFAVEKGGIVCDTGILGGEFSLNGFDPIKEIPNGVYLSGFYSNYPDEQTMQDIFAFLDAHQLKPQIGACYDCAQIQEACQAQEAGQVNGKIVVKVN